MMLRWLVVEVAGIESLEGRKTTVLLCLAAYLVLM